MAAWHDQCGITTWPDVDRPHTPAYAAPGRSSNLEGLPPAFIQVGGLDPLRDEALIYAQRLMAAGVPVSENDRTTDNAARLYSSAVKAALA